MTTIDPVESQICKAIRNIDINLLRGDREWTKAIFKAVASLGDSLKYKVCSSSRDGEHDAGWLFDLVWYENDSQERLKSIPLILESEWNRSYSRIKYDFEKLLIAKSKYKIMLFQAKGQKKSDYFNRLQSGIEAFHLTSLDETYFLICFDEQLWAFDIRTLRSHGAGFIVNVVEADAQPALAT